MEKALDITGDGHERATILNLAGTFASASGQIDRAIELLTEAIEQVGDDRDLRVAAQTQLGQVYFFGSKLEESEAMLLNAVAQLGERSDTPAGAKLFTQLARICVFQGKYAEGEAYTAKAMPPAERAGDIALIAEGLITRGVAAIVSGRTHEADALLNGALQLSEKKNLIRQQTRALVNISANQLAIHPASVLETTAKALPLTQRYGVVDQRSYVLANSIEACAHLGRWEEGRELISEGADLADMSWVVLPASCQLEAYAGDVVAARSYLERVEPKLSVSDSNQDKSALAACRAAIALAEGDYSRVFAVVGPAREAAVDETIRPYGLVAHAALWAKDLDEARAELGRLERSTIRNDWHTARSNTLLAGITGLEGDRDRAIEMFEDAFGEWNKLEIPLGKAMSQVDFVVTLGGPEAASAADEAEAFFAKAGHQRLVELLRRERAK
jgi:tetratricopeptide (TPR) repeat protein